jgi:type IV secretory pathway VirB3-like protein
LIASVSTIEMVFLSFAASVVVVYWRNPGLLMASAVWVPIYFVSYIAVLISYNFDGYALARNPHFSEWGVFFLSLLAYQLPVVLIYSARQYIWRREDP